jgi:hypothetical protein
MPGLLRVDPERRFFTPPSKGGLGAAEWVNFFVAYFSLKRPDSFPLIIS